MTDRELSFMLSSLAGQVRRLAPSHRDPERFHADKSEIEATLRRLSRAVTDLNTKSRIGLHP